ncbi:hypothetical protein TNCV_1033291 [Trichonephila clavipes]|nr:hypothetical protein TNCV_1033291 [Trichonephila clavipes]
MVTSPLLHQSQSRIILVHNGNNEVHRTHHYFCSKNTQNLRPPSEKKGKRQSAKRHSHAGREITRIFWKVTRTPGRETSPLILNGVPVEIKSPSRESGAVAFALFRSTLTEDEIQNFSNNSNIKCATSYLNDM